MLWLTLAIVLIASHLCYPIALQFKNLDAKTINNKLQFKIGGEYFTTNNNAYARISLSKQNRFSFMLELAYDTLQIIYPVNGLVLVPKDSNAVVDIIIGRIKDFELYRKISYKLDEANRKIRGTEDVCKYLKETFDGLLKLTQDSVDLRHKRDSIYPVITPLFNRYVLNLQNLAYAFERFSYSDFSDSVLKRNVNAKMLDYNITFDSLYIMKDNIKKWINDYWRNDNLQNDLNLILSDCLEKHTVKVLTIRNQIRGIDDLSRTKKSKKKYKNQIDEATFTLKHIIVDDLKVSARHLSENINKLNVQLTN